MTTSANPLRWRLLTTLLLAALLTGSMPSCGNKQVGSSAAEGRGMAKRVPIQEIAWERRGGRESLIVREAVGGLCETRNVYGNSPKDRGSSWLEGWMWHGATLQKDVVAELPDPYYHEVLKRQVPSVTHVMLLPNNRYIACPDPWTITLTSVQTKEVIQKWQIPEEWTLDRTELSRTGRYMALSARQGSEYKARGDFTGRARVAIIDTTTLELQWAGRLEEGGLAGTVRQVLPSNDGKYVAVGGWSGSAGVIEAASQKVLWLHHPDDVIALTEVAFSSDGSKVYAAGDWAVRCYETLTGKELGRWAATPTGEAVYGYRIQCLAISPDDAWVAAGMGPNGDVWLIHVAGTEKPVLLPHGIMTTDLLSFSPDSQYLATVAGGVIKIWKVKP
jgi:WD40 repeat protein